jgi:sulfoxide reductase heme-binding subunit YedZ
LTVPLASSPSAYWYTTRGAGTVALVLLTASVAIGVVDFSRWQSQRWPRFAIDGVHRVVSLLAIAVVAIHVLTTVLDGFTHIGFRDAFLPFASSYRPIWLGAGALAFDLLLALAVTSLLRRRIGYRVWRLVHWAAYASWPLALVHGLGTGTDATVTWMLAISLACLGVVLGAVGWRIATAWPRGDSRRALAWSGITVGLAVAAVWAVQGPLASNWAGRAGTPTSILTAFSKPTDATQAATAAASPDPVAAAKLGFPFSSRLSGRILQRSGGSGLVDVDIRAVLRGAADGTLEIQILGQPLGAGGVSMQSSKVSVGPAGEPLLYQGQVTALNGSEILANVSNGQDTGRLRVRLSIDQGTRRVSGTVDGTSGGAQS